MAKTSVKPLVYKPEDAMILLSVGRCKIYELIRSGELKTVRVGKKYLVPMKSIEEFLEAHMMH